MRVVRVFGPIGQASGYGQAVRNFCEAFSISKVPTRFEFAESQKKYVQDLEAYPGTANTDFYLHCPPYDKHKTHNYKIAYFYWEADRLPAHWSKSLNKVNEIWVPCQLVRHACLAAGFRGILKVIPTPVKPFDLSLKIGIPASFSDQYILSDNVFKFYSIFQWQERKGFKELLRAYYSTFTSDDNVVLILKVNPLNNQADTKAKIYQDIQKIKNTINKKNLPPVYLSKEIVNIKDIYALHNSADCYVAPHHGEGWGMPIHDAMYAGKQIITTKYGGVTEYLNDSNSHIINHELGPVSNMEWSPLYNSSQKWAYPNVKHLGELMRDVYLNSSKYKEKGQQAKIVAEKMTIQNIAKLLEKELSLQ